MEADPEEEMVDHLAFGKRAVDGLHKGTSRNGPAPSRLSGTCRSRPFRVGHRTRSRRMCIVKANVHDLRDALGFLASRRVDWAEITLSGW